jgi:hypothetical protein
MENEIGIWLEKRKVKYSKWREILKEETLNGKVVRVFTEVCGKDSISVFYIDKGNIHKRTMKTKRYGEIPGIRCKDVRGFNGFLKSGDVIDIGEGGTIFDHSVRYGAVTRLGEIVWRTGDPLYQDQFLIL